jgi:energy-converting hydrogenase Eha subunit F
MTNLSHYVPVSLAVGIAGVLILLGVQPHTMTVAQTQPNNNNNTTNQSLATYENKELGFAFDYPANWHSQYDAYEAELNNVVIAIADPYSNDTNGFEQTSFWVNVSDVREFLDSDLH